jgi:SH2 domain
MASGPRGKSGAGKSLPGGDGFETGRVWFEETFFDGQSPDLPEGDSNAAKNPTIDDVAAKLLDFLIGGNRDERLGSASSDATEADIQHTFYKELAGKLGVASAPYLFYCEDPEEALARYGTRTLVVAHMRPVLSMLFQHVYRCSEPQKGARGSTDDATEVDMALFELFLAYFGPLDARMFGRLAVTAEPWFHGDLGSDEASRLIRPSPPRTFVLRLSSSFPGYFTVSSNQRSNCVHSRLFWDVQGVMDLPDGTLLSGGVLRDRDGFGMGRSAPKQRTSEGVKVHASLQEFVKAHEQKLADPLAGSPFAKAAAWPNFDNLPPAAYDHVSLEPHVSTVDGE